MYQCPAVTLIVCLFYSVHTKREASKVIFFRGVFRGVGRGHSPPLVSISSHLKITKLIFKHCLPVLPLMLLTAAPLFLKYPKFASPPFAKFLHTALGFGVHVYMCVGWIGGSECPQFFFISHRTVGSDLSYFCRCLTDSLAILTVLSSFSFEKTSTRAVYNWWVGLEKVVNNELALCIQ